MLLLLLATPMTIVAQSDKDHIPPNGEWNSKYLTSPTIKAIGGTIVADYTTTKMDGKDWIIVTENNAFVKNMEFIFMKLGNKPEIRIKTIPDFERRGCIKIQTTYILTPEWHEKVKKFQSSKPKT